MSLSLARGAAEALACASAAAGTSAAPLPTATAARRIRTMRRMFPSSPFEAGGAADERRRIGAGADLIEKSETGRAGTGKEAADRARAGRLTQGSGVHWDGQSARVEF